MAITLKLYTALPSDSKRLLGIAFQVKGQVLILTKVCIRY